MADLASRLHAEEIVLAITHRHTMTAAAFDALLECRERGLHITTMAALYERLLGRVPVEHVGRDVAAVLPTDSVPSLRLFYTLKRGIDLLAGIVGGLGLCIVIPFVALANALWGRGPLFFRQKRVGMGGKIFLVCKFRTMVPDAEHDTGPVWSRKDDPRTTSVGRFLRKSRIDELPQIINVLRGEMSLVGPRPERPQFVEQLAAQIPFYRARHAVRPGITGWAQVRYRYGSSVEDSRIKLEYDLYYVKNQDLALDALIMLKTLAVVFSLQGT
jgi:lipopolysaccharide/colanic/teichoic acid biosynthesis glycosyltransferase